jgi:hypothetical protein
LIDSPIGGERPDIWIIGIAAVAVDDNNFLRGARDGCGAQNAGIAGGDNRDNWAFGSSFTRRDENWYPMGRDVRRAHEISFDNVCGKFEAMQRRSKSRRWDVCKRHSRA